MKGRSPRSGQAATSRASKPSDAAQAQMSSRLRLGRQAVRNPSFMVRPPALGGCTVTSTQPPSRDDRSTASVMSDGPGAVGEGRQPVDLGAVAGVDGPQGVGDEGVEAVLVALRVAGRDRGVGRRGRVELVRVALDDLRRAAPPHPEGVGVLLVEGQRGAVGHDLEPQLVLVAGRDLAHHHRAAHAGDGAEQHQGHVLGARPSAAGRALSPPPAAAKAGTWSPRVLALGHRGHELRAHRRQTVAGDELDEVAPVRADVGEGPRRAGQLGVDAPVVVLVGRQPVLQVAPVGEAHGERTVGDPGPRLADHRVEAVDERHRGDGARPVGGGHQLGRRRRGRSPAASRTPRACPPRGRPGPAGACRWFGVQMWTTSTSGEVASSSGGEAALRARAGPRPRRWCRATRPPPPPGGRRPVAGRGRGPRR